VAVGVARQHAGPAQELVEERVDEAELVEVLGAEDVARQDRVGDDDPLKRCFFLKEEKGKKKRGE